MENNLIQKSKCLVIFAIASLFGLVAVGNIIDYPTNFEYVTHVMCMDTVFTNNSHTTYRAINSPILHHISYSIIITLELLVSVTLFIALARLYSHIDNIILFNKAKELAILGLTIGALIYGFCFFTIGGEWFMSWQSKIWNAKSPSQAFINYIMLSLIFVSIPDR